MTKTINTCLAIFLILSLFSCQTRQQAINPKLLASGVSSELAELRRNQLGEVHYNLSFDIPLKKEDSIAAELLLTFSLEDFQHPVILDFKESPGSVLRMEVNGRNTNILWENEHLIIPVSNLKQGENSIQIQFIAGELSLNRNEDYLYTLLVPDRARTLFPCFDQPDIKASFTLRISAPEDWEVLCGAPLHEKNNLDGRSTYQFLPSDKMSTYLFSFVAGAFKKAVWEETTEPMKMLYRETSPAKILSSRDTIFRQHIHSKNFMEAYTGISYPFHKLDFATIPGYQYGGMEHVGAIQYREEILFQDSSATKSQELGRAKLIAHETAHMWFGNLVTMKWFSDVWLKEVFANFMADKIINPVFPGTNHTLKFMLDHHPNAYSVDRTRGSNAIRQHLPNLADAGSLYGDIIYHKAPIMMWQLERILGEETFRNGLREYLNTYSFGNADWDDLVRILDALSPMDIAQWSQVWVNSTGRPRIFADVQYQEDQTIESLVLTQKAEDSTQKIWPQVFEIGLVYPDTVKILDVELYDRQLALTAVKGWPKPQAILYNSSGYGYGIFPVTREALEAIWQQENPIVRGSGYINAFENTLNGALAPAHALRFFEQGLAKEYNELVLRYLTGAIGQLYWMYLDAEERTAHQKSLQEQLISRLKGREEANIKKTLFELFKSIAYNSWGKEQLYLIWSGQLKIPDLKLNENDYTSLAMILAVYEHPKTSEILEQAREALSNPDQIRRFDYLLPALSADETIRRRFFESLRDPKKREKESWVISACYYIHHPLRQKSSIRYLPLSLELLPEIAATGDIFFPKAWLSNTIGHYQSGEAYSVLENYLAGSPELNDFLKAKLLQAADDLYRYREMQKGAQVP